MIKVNKDCEYKMENVLSIRKKMTQQEIQEPHIQKPLFHLKYAVYARHEGKSPAIGCRGDGGLTTSGKIKIIDLD